MTTFYIQKIMDQRRKKKFKQTKEVVIAWVRYDGGLDQGVDIDGGKAVEKWIDSRDIQEEKLIKFSDGLNVELGDRDCQGCTPGNWLVQLDK